VNLGHGLEPTVTQNSPFLPQQWPWPLPVRGMARLSWPGWLVKPDAVTHLDTNRARRNTVTTLLLRPDRLPCYAIA